MQNHEEVMAEYFDNDLVQGVVETIRESTVSVQQETSLCQNEQPSDRLVGIEVSGCGVDEGNLPLT